jgi:hypothetical protein
MPHGSPFDYGGEIQTDALSPAASSWPLVIFFGAISQSCAALFQ